MPTTTTAQTASSIKADNDIELTAEEAKQLETAFKDADFCKLLSDYVSEISNPEFKEEQEKYTLLNWRLRMNYLRAKHWFVHHLALLLNACTRRSENKTQTSSS